MKKLEFNFDEDSFNKLFPFYILIDSNLKIKGFGKSLAKTFPKIKLNDNFSSAFEVKRPFAENRTFESFKAIFDQLVVLGTSDNNIDLRGQFQQLNDSILFIGSPWFTSMNQVRERKLVLHDFAFHDPLLDLLHVLKTQEITTQELKELLIKINNQKKDLKRDQDELNRLSLVASANENGVVFTKSDGTIFWCNDAYLKLTGFSKEEIIGRTPVQVGKCEFTNKEDLKRMIGPFLKGEKFDVELVHGRKDGSKDKTLEVLQELRKGKEDYISIYDCEKNGGKAEAVRLGMLHLAKQTQFDYIGFLDADLSTNFEDFDDLVQTISNSKYKIVSGSRINRMGADIAKESARAIISKTINFIIRKTLGMDFKDTQCGAKIMSKEVIEKTFQKKFLTKWLFDVEIFMRMRNIYGLERTKKMVCEKPLNRWVHMDGSKLSFKDSFKIIFQIGQIAVHYK